MDELNGVDSEEEWRGGERRRGWETTTTTMPEVEDRRELVELVVQLAFQDTWTR